MNITEEIFETRSC